MDREDAAKIAEAINSLIKKRILEAQAIMTASELGAKLAVMMRTAADAAQEDLATELMSCALGHEDSD